jgi:hypothetical protein
VAERIDDFAGTDLDLDTWLPHYLPCWSSLARTRASYAVRDSVLSLSVPADVPRWCPQEHPEPLRVSGIQSGNFSGPVGSMLGQQRFRDGLRVAEQQERFEGWLVGPGRIEVTCAMDLSPRSMAALWLSGFEDPVDDAGEICVVEVFGRSIDAGSVEVGCGIKQVFDPRLVHDFDAPRIDLDITAFHTYAAEWDDTSATFSVDGTVLRTSASPPTYPMQIMIGVFEFPNWTDGNDDDHVPRFDIDLVSASGSVSA